MMPLLLLSVQVLDVTCHGASRCRIPHSYNQTSAELTCNVRDCALLQDATDCVRAAVRGCRSAALACAPHARAVVLFSQFSQCDEAACPLQETQQEQRYIVGALNLTNNMTFRIPTGATIRGVFNASMHHFPPVFQYAPYGDGTTPGWMPHEGSDNDTDPVTGQHTNGWALSPLIGSEVGAEHIALEGGGVIDGGGWWWWSNRGINNGEGIHPRGPRNIEPFMCKDFTIDGLTIRNPADWNVRNRCDAKLLAIYYCIPQLQSSICFSLLTLKLYM